MPATALEKARAEYAATLPPEPKRASAAKQRAALETMRARRGKLLREVDRLASTAMDAGQVPDPAAARDAFIDSMIIERWIKAQEPVVERAERDEAAAADRARQQRQAEWQDKREREEKAALAAAVAWLEPRIAGQPVRARELIADAAKEGIPAALLHAAAGELGVVPQDHWHHGMRTIGDGDEHWALSLFTGWHPMRVR